MGLHGLIDVLKSYFYEYPYDDNDDDDDYKLLRLSVAVLSPACCLM